MESLLGHRAAPALAEWLIKKLYIARLASGPRGSVKELLMLPPDQACPIPYTFQYSCISFPLLSFHLYTV
jgi:hypothetical protein